MAIISFYFLYRFSSTIYLGHHPYFIIKDIYIEKQKRKSSSDNQEKKIRKYAFYSQQYINSIIALEMLDLKNINQGNELSKEDYNVCERRFKDAVKLLNNNIDIDFDRALFLLNENVAIGHQKSIKTLNEILQVKNIPLKELERIKMKYKF